MLRFTVADSERVDLPGLELQQLELGRATRTALTTRVEIVLERLPRGVVGRDCGGQIFVPAVRVEQGTLGGRFEQRLMRVLPVDVHEQAAESLQVLQRSGLTVDERTGAAIAADDASQCAARAIVEAAFRKPTKRIVTLWDLE